MPVGGTCRREHPRPALFAAGLSAFGLGYLHSVGFGLTHLADAWEGGARFGPGGWWFAVPIAGSILGVADYRGNDSTLHASTGFIPALPQIVGVFLLVLSIVEDEVSTRGPMSLTADGVRVSF